MTRDLAARGTPGLWPLVPMLDGLAAGDASNADARPWGRGNTIETDGGSCRTDV